MGLHTSGEDYLEAVLVIKKIGHGTFRRCGPTHGSVETQCVPCSINLKRERLSYNG